MPRLWLDYCQFLMDQGRVTHTRRTFDRALRALPITQHSRIWPLYLRFLRSHPLPETAVRGYRRFLKVSLLESEAGPGQAGGSVLQVKNSHNWLSGTLTPCGMSPNSMWEKGSLRQVGRLLFAVYLFILQIVSNTCFTCVPSTWQDEEDIETRAGDSVTKTVPASRELSV